MKRFLLFIFLIPLYIVSLGQTVLEEDFSVFPPENWTRGNAILNNVYNGSQISNILYGWYAETNGYGISGNHTKADIYGSSIKYWLISPVISLTGEDYLLSFNLALTGDDVASQVNAVGSDDKFVVLILEDGQNISQNNELLRLDNVSQTRLEDIGSDTLITLSLSGYSGNVRIAFYVESLVSNADYDLHIGHILVEQAEECIAPNFETGNIGQNYVEISFDNDADLETCIIEYTAVEDADWENSSTETITVFNQPYTITNLLPNHDYKIRGKSVCSINESEYTQSQEFHTLCNDATMEVFHTICQGETYVFNSGEINEEGIYTAVLQNIYGCDSIVRLHLSISPLYDTSISKTIYLGDTLFVGGNTYTQSGTYTLTLHSINGCDSIVNLTLQTISIDTLIVFDTITITTYDTVTITDTVFITQYDTVAITDTLYIHDTITECGINKTTIYANINQGEVYQDFGFNEGNAGEYYQILQTDNECDSIVCLHLGFYSSLSSMKQQNGILCYPNPVHDKIYVEGEGEITITDNWGRTVFKETSFRRQRMIDTKDFDSGIYYLRLGDATQKIIIQK